MIIMMKKAKKRTIRLILGFIFIILIYTLIYHNLYEVFENKDASYIDSLQTVVESVTTAGFGGDAPWSSNVLNLFVTIMNLTGVTIFFFTIPLVVVPYMRSILSEPPKNTSIKDHIIVVSNNPLEEESLVEQLSEADFKYVIIEEDEDIANKLYRKNKSVIHSDPKTKQGLKSANIEEADSIICSVYDDTNLSIIYTAMQVNPDIEINSVVRDRRSDILCRNAGCDDVFNVSKKVGSILSEHSINKFSHSLESTLEGEYDFEITKITVFEKSPIANMSVRDFSKKYLDNQTIIGGHFGDNFVVSPSSNDIIEKNSLIYIIGDLDEDIKYTKSSKIESYDGNKILICGNGRMGSEVYSRIQDTEQYDPVSIDLDENKDPDIVGDITEPSTYDEINLSEYKTAVIAIDDDIEAIYSCALLSSMSEEFGIVSRANTTGNVHNMYLAGSDYVLLVPRVINSHWESKIGENDNIYNLHRQNKMSVVKNTKYEDKTISETDIGRDIGVRIVAVKHNDKWIKSGVSDLSMNLNDELIVVGKEDEIEEARNEFADLY